MVICKKHKFVFIRIPKNASTSLATFFIRSYCDKDDIYTAVGDANIHSRNVSQNLINKYRYKYRFIHLSLQELVDNDVIDEPFLRDKKVIGCIREPLDRQLSLYFFLRRGNKTSPEDFREMFSRGYCAGDPSNEIPQSEYTTLNGIDYGEHWLYDNLKDHLNDFIKDHQSVVRLQNYKSSLRNRMDKEKLIDEYYDQKTLDAVKRYYEKDFELYEELKNGKN